jgi:hypothetical protein
MGDGREPSNGGGPMPPMHGPQYYLGTEAGWTGLEGTKTAIAGFPINQTFDDGFNVGHRAGYQMAHSQTSCSMEELTQTPHEAGGSSGIFGQRGGTSCASRERSGSDDPVIRDETRI